MNPSVPALLGPGAPHGIRNFISGDQNGGDGATDDSMWLVTSNGHPADHTYRGRRRPDQMACLMDVMVKKVSENSQIRSFEV